MQFSFCLPHVYSFSVMAFCTYCSTDGHNSGTVVQRCRQSARCSCLASGRGTCPDPCLTLSGLRLKYVYGRRRQKGGAVISTVCSEDLSHKDKLNTIKT